MANIFIVVDCKKRVPILATLSARKAVGALKGQKSGIRVEVWQDHAKVTIAYPKNYYELDPYTQLEKQFIGRKQKKAEERNKRRRPRQ